MFYVLIALVAVSRFLPHPPNVACIGALGLFAGCFLSGRRAYLVPVAALFCGDLIGQVLGVTGKGFYNPLVMAMVYSGVLLTVPVGRWISRNQSKLRLPAGSLAASTIFFVTSNFGVWLGGWYSMTFGGLVLCYANAIPFFGYTIAGDLFFSVLLFSAWGYSRSGIRRLAPQRALRLAPVLGNLALQEIGAARHLVHAFDAVFDADPVVIETGPLQFGEDRVIVV